MNKQPPTPKYSIGETIFFDRSHLSYAKGEGKQLGKIHCIELILAEEDSISRDTGNIPGVWQVLYYTEHDDPVPEECILGVATVGEKR